MKSDLKQTAREKPAQLFWTKRLGNLTPASYDDLNENGNEEDSFDDEDLAVIEVKSNKHNILPNKAERKNKIIYPIFSYNTKYNYISFR